MKRWKIALIFCWLVGMVALFIFWGSANAAGDGKWQNLSGRSLGDLTAIYTSGGVTYNTLEDGDAFLLFDQVTHRTFMYIFDIDSAATENSLTVVTPDNISAGNAYSGNARWLLSETMASKVLGGVDIITDDDSLSNAQCWGSVDVLDGGAETVTLPAAVVGMSITIYSIDATVKNIDPNGTDHIWLDGVDTENAHQIESPGAVGNFITLACFTATHWTTMGRSGLWVIHHE